MLRFLILRFSYVHYSNSFKYRIPLGENSNIDSEVIVYSNQSGIAGNSTDSWSPMNIIRNPRQTVLYFSAQHYSKPFSLDTPDMC